MNRASAFAAILPYLDQDAAYKKYDFKLGNADPANLPVVSLKIPGYICPSAVFLRQVPIAGCDANDRAPGTYAVSATSRDPWGTFASGQPHDGAIVNIGSGTTRIQDIRDGTSSTLLAGESDWNIPDYLFGTSPPTPCAGQMRGGFTYWSSPYPLATAFTTMAPFNPKSGGSAVLSRFRSDHSGNVVQFVFCDGATRSLNQNISQTVLTAITTRNGKETAGEF